MAKMGRPRVKKAEALSEFYSCRLRPDESRAVQTAIKNSGMSKPDWMRAVLLKAAGNR